MTGLFYLLLFYFLGECAARATGGVVPGSVIGMMLLFMALYFKVIRKEDVRDAARFLLDHILLFLIPVCAGLMVSWPLVAGHWAAIVAACVVSTLAILAVVGAMQQGFERRRKNRLS